MSTERIACTEIGRDKSIDVFTASDPADGIRRRDSGYTYPGGRIGRRDSGYTYPKDGIGRRDFGCTYRAKKIRCGDFGGAKFAKRLFFRAKRPNLYLGLNFL